MFGHLLFRSAPLARLVFGPASVNPTASSVTKVVTTAGIVSTIVSMHFFSQQPQQAMCMPANKLKVTDVPDTVEEALSLYQLNPSRISREWMIGHIDQYAENSGMRSKPAGEQHAFMQNEMTQLQSRDALVPNLGIRTATSRQACEFARRLSKPPQRTANLAGRQARAPDLPRNAMRRAAGTRTARRPPG